MDRDVTEVEIMTLKTSRRKGPYGVGGSILGKEDAWGYEVVWTSPAPGCAGADREGLFLNQLNNCKLLSSTQCHKIG
jgi:hypothetical protein